MKHTRLFFFIFIPVILLTISCKKNQASQTIDGIYSGHFVGVIDGNDTIVNTGYQVTVTATDKNKANVFGNLFGTFEVLVTPNGLNVELVSPTDGLNQFLYEGETQTLTFNYTHAGDTAIYNGIRLQ